MKRLFLLFLVLTMCVVTSLAQHHRPRLSPEQFKAKLEQNISQRAGLTSDEAKALFPIFHEMKEKQREMGKQLFRLKEKCLPDGCTDKECAERLNQIKHLQVQMAQAEETYYRKMCKVVSAKKVYAVMRAEDEFHREMLSRFNHKKK